VLKALVTQASSAIPVMPLYISILYKIMKEEGTHEGCIEQIHGLFSRQLYTSGERELDEQGRLRMDGLELKDSVQNRVKDVWDKVTTESLDELTDFRGYRQGFLKLFGFGIDGVDYDGDVNPLVDL
jgi:enoyl-[acyl-carrier protein] reductase / trans-2-enoyl-CoA reductase (NAD+)